MARRMGCPLAGAVRYTIPTPKGRNSTPKLAPKKASLKTSHLKSIIGNVKGERFDLSFWFVGQYFCTYNTLMKQSTPAGFLSA
jgi:hypothetical protein